MAIQHSTIVDASRHEPKGVSTANLGDVYVADGAGSGAWAKVAGDLFGDMDFSQNTVDTTITITSAVPAAAGFVLLTGATLTTPGPLYSQGVIDTITFENTANNELLRVQTAGIYEVSGNFSFTGGGGGAGNIYRFNYAVNGIENTAHSYALRQTSSGDVGSCGFSEYVQLAVNDTVQACVANQSGVNNPTVLTSSLTLIIIKAL